MFVADFASVQAIFAMRQVMVRTKCITTVLRWRDTFDWYDCAKSGLLLLAFAHDTSA